MAVNEGVTYSTMVSDVELWLTSKLKGCPNRSDSSVYIMLNKLHQKLSKITHISCTISFEAVSAANTLFWGLRLKASSS